MNIILTLFYISENNFSIWHILCMFITFKVFQWLCLHSISLIAKTIIESLNWLCRVLIDVEWFQPRDRGDRPVRVWGLWVREPAPDVPGGLRVTPRLSVASLQRSLLTGTTNNAFTKSNIAYALKWNTVKLSSNFLSGKTLCVCGIHILGHFSIFKGSKNNTY